MYAPIFIVGCERSGTTLLRLILNQSPELHIPGESWFLKKLNANHEVYGDFSKPYQRWFFIRDLQLNNATQDTYTFDIFQLSIDEAEKVIEDVSPTDFFGASSALFQASACKHGKQRWADKTPRHVIQLQWLANAYPSAKFVHVIRDGRDVALSLVKAGWANNIQEAAGRWQQRVRSGIDEGRKLRSTRYYELQYESLVTQPEAVLKDLCHWVDIEYSSKMLQHHSQATEHINRDWHLHEMVAKPISSDHAYKWKKKLTNLQIAEIEGVAGVMLEELGYELASKAIFQLSDKIRRYSTKISKKASHYILNYQT
ncbi:sulfotransferase [Acaryochloris sp. IP29b_bin.148]|uniref:sulfotransferase family protein n=1 Tax=Acaryochloris sp. IP29b_bin.148 TaxID=2969218 RepID=UPI00260D7B05|nr:sulfotransferase [Acaryochloris sp. IP29b_bin.148]